jgi:hypothetical protein
MDRQLEMTKLEILAAYNSKQLHNAGGRISFLLTILPASQKVVFSCKQKASMVFQ